MLDKIVTYGPIWECIFKLKNLWKLGNSVMFAPNYHYALDHLTCDIVFASHLEQRTEKCLVLAHCANSKIFPRFALPLFICFSHLAIGTVSSVNY